jgi:mannose/fructose/N-acetylgalactosamine-specific phosphotransferase system component IIB
MRSKISFDQNTQKKTRVGEKMPIIFTRIDDRLIHGQVVESWIPFLSIDEVLIVSDALTQDENRIDLMKLSLPEHVKLKTKNINQAVEYLKHLKTDKKILLLAPGPCEILQLINAGVTFETVNVGGLHYSVGKVQMGRAVTIDDKDMECFKKITDKGVKLEGRGVPTDRPIDILSRLVK